MGNETRSVGHDVQGWGPVREAELKGETSGNGLFADRATPHQNLTEPVPADALLR